MTALATTVDVPMALNSPALVIDREFKYGRNSVTTQATTHLRVWFVPTNILPEGSGVQVGSGRGGETTRCSIVTIATDVGIGNSVTNMAEELVESVARFVDKIGDEPLGISFEDITLIEHYLATETPPPRSTVHGNFNLVTFNRGSSGEAQNPDWSRLSEDDLTDILRTDEWRCDKHLSTSWSR